MESAEAEIIGGRQALENVSTRRSKKVKNLEKEVEMILSQDESDEETKSPKKEDTFIPKTPTTTRRHTKATMCTTPRASESSVLQDMLQTPRRSCRKSIKPPQDYDDIIVRQSTRSNKKKLIPLSENNEENETVVVCPPAIESVSVEEQHKWTAADVGRSSTKRSSRKSKRATRGKRNLNEENKMEDEKVHISSNKSEEMIETVPTKVSKTEVESVVFECPKETLYSTTTIKQENESEVEEHIEAKGEVYLIQDDVEGSPQEPEEEIHLIQEDGDEEDDVPVVNDEMPVEVQIKEEEEDIVLIQEDDAGENIPTNAYNNVVILDEEEDQPEEEIHLILEDTEDCKEFAGNSNNSQTSFAQIKDEHTDVNATMNVLSEVKQLVEENNEEDMQITIDSLKDEATTKSSKQRRNNKDQNVKTIPQSENPSANESFGCYLKSKEIDIKDLGLNPLNDDEEDEKKQEVKQLPLAPQEMSEDMPSLIVCDEEEETEKTQTKKQKLNETFDADDSVVIVATDEGTSHSNNSEAVEMDTLQMSDDEECQHDQGPAKKMPRIMLTTTDEQNQTLLSTPPRQIRKPYRFPTPYRNRSESKVNKENATGSAKKLPITRENLNLSATAFTTMTPRDIVLRGIRKRSISICLGADELAAKGPATLTRSAKKSLRKAVNFYSPANQTAIIEDFDKLIEKSVKKSNKQTTEINSKNKNVTTRRKRSMSFDDSMMMSKSLCVSSRLPRPVTNQTQALNNTVTTTTASSSSASKVNRTKLPNFAAIHEKRFKKMENLADYVARKQERSKVLINSTSKLKPVSAQKNVALNIKNTQNEKPKASKKIDMSSQMRPVSKIPSSNATTTKPAPRKIVSTEDNKPSSILPDPKNARIIKPIYPRKHLKPTQSFNVSSSAVSKSATNITLKQHKPAFNLSTNLGSGVGITTQKPSSSANNTSMMENKMLSTQDKMASRLQRHIDLFKGRVPAARAGVASRKNEAAIRGVRSNRRFELQMQHRKNTEN